MNVGVRHWICQLKQNPWSPWAHHVCTVNKQVPVFCHRNIDPACRSNAGWRRELGKRLEDLTRVKPGSPGQGMWLQTQLIAEKHPRPATPALAPHRQRSCRREPPKVETFSNKSFNFLPVDTAALTQSHVWGTMSRKPGTTECFSTGTHNCWLLRVVLCSVLSMWYLNWTFSWPPKGNSFKRKNFKSAKSQIMAQHREKPAFCGFYIKIRVSQCLKTVARKCEV